MMPTRQTLPALGPRPPAISRLYLSIAFLLSARQSTPSGTWRAPPEPLQQLQRYIQIWPPLDKCRRRGAADSWRYVHPFGVRVRSTPSV